MPDVHSPVICFRIADSRLAARWIEVLSAAGCNCLPQPLARAAAQRGDSPEIDVLVVDTLVVDTLVVDSVPLLAADEHSQSPDNAQPTGKTAAADAKLAGPAIVLLGEAVGQEPNSPGVDAVLSASAGEHELTQTIRLVAEIAHLRRQFHRSRQARQDLTRLALSDPLTRLANRRAWDAQLARRIATCVTERQSLCVAVLDLDQFKQINDQFGFAAGDAVLAAAANSVAAQLRAGDFVARLGGDEFGLLLADVKAAQAEAIADRLRRGLAEHLAKNSPVPVTASIGLCVLSGLGKTDPAEILARADAALRSAKRAGRNRTVTDFDEP